MKKRYQIDNIVSFVIIVVSAVLMVVPLYFTILNAFKPNAEIAANIAAWPIQPTLDNFVKVWKRLDFPMIFSNTLIITVGSAIGCVVFSGMLGYWIARHVNWFTKTWNALLLCGMCVPFQCIMIGFAQIIGKVGLAGTTLGVMVSNWCFSLPMCVFLVSGAVKAVPYEIEEAAIIDGCSSFKVFWQIIFPLIKGTVFTVICIQVIKYWNDYLLPQFFLSRPSQRTIQIAMQVFFNETQFSWDLAVAAVSLSVLPLFVFFVFAQKQVLEGATVGSVKG
jgi:raffinose/stachyose/melibiose transport system permease protein